MSASQVDYRANCLKLADYLEHNVAPDRYYHPSADSSCGSPCCAYGYARNSGLFNIPNIQSRGIDVEEAEKCFGTTAFGNIFSGSAFMPVTRHPTIKEVIIRIREFADANFPASPSRPTGAEVCLAIMQNPFSEKEHVGVVG